MIDDIKIGDHVNVKCSRSKLFYWMNNDSFDGSVIDKDDSQYIKIKLLTELQPGRFTDQIFWLNTKSPDVTAIEKL